jgi:hypothetical protein
LVDESDRHAREDETEVLAQIGQCLFRQDLRITVRLPARLAARALAAWGRDDTGATQTETQPAQTIRHQAGAPALIGLALGERGVGGVNDEVEVALDAWQIGKALDAAEQRGLLAEESRDSAG